MSEVRTGKVALYHTFICYVVAILAIRYMYSVLVTGYATYTNTRFLSTQHDVELTHTD